MLEWRLRSTAIDGGGAVLGEGAFEKCAHEWMFWRRVEERWSGVLCEDGALVDEKNVIRKIPREP